MDPNLPVPSKIGQKSEMCLNSTAQNAQNSTYSSIQNKNILSVTQWELLLFHVLTLELFIALELTQKELSQTKIFGGSIVQVKILAACKILGKWTFIFLISSTFCCWSILQFFYSRDIPTVVLFQIL